MKNYEQLIETNNKYLGKNKKAKKYDIKSCYFNDFISGTKEPTAALTDVFNYGFVCGHKQATEEYNNIMLDCLQLDSNTSESKKKLLQLIYDMPFWADEFYRYLYTFLVCGMTRTKSRFPMSIGHEEEVLEYCTKLSETKTEAENKTAVMDPTEKEHTGSGSASLSGSLCNTINVITKINHAEVLDFISAVSKLCISNANENGNIVCNEKFIKELVNLTGQISK